MVSPQEWKAYSGGDGAGGPDIGTYNPRDYTTKSFSKFTQTGNPSDLERYAPSQSIMIADVPHVYDPVKGEYRPTETTAEDVGEDKSTIASMVETAKAEAQAAAAKKISEVGQFQKLEQADQIYNSLSNADLDLIYGSLEPWYPDFFRSQKGVDLIEQRDQLVGMLKLASRGELKGQGPITEGEQEILGKAATTLGSDRVSPDLARKALDGAMKVLYRNAGQEFSIESGSQVKSLVDKYAD